MTQRQCGVRSEELEERKHSRFFSPSALHRRIACTGSALMEDGKPDEPSEYAKWGTAAHSICERCVVEGKRPSDWKVGLMVKDVDDVRVDQEMIDACEQALAMMWEITRGADDIETEKRVEYPAVPDMRGTIDVLVDEPFGRLIVCDYKFGAGVKVDVAYNPQLMAYALMAAGEALDTYEEIRLAIIQPRVSGRPDLCVIPPSTLAKWRDEVLMPTVEAIKSGNVEYHPGPETCRWCKGANDCPAYAKAALELAKLDFAELPQSGEAGQPPLGGGLEQPPSSREVEAKPPEGVTVTPELVARVYPQLPLLEDFIERVRAMAFDMCSNGGLPGYKLVEGRGRREWINEEQAVKFLEGNGQDPWERKLISPAKAEKLGPEIKKLAQQHIKRLPGNPVIAPESDKRRAIFTAAEDFAEINN